MSTWRINGSIPIQISLLIVMDSNIAHQWIDFEASGRSKATGSSLWSSSVHWSSVWNFLSTYMSCTCRYVNILPFWSWNHLRALSQKLWVNGALICCFWHQSRARSRDPIDGHGSGGGCGGVGYRLSKFGGTKSGLQEYQSSAWKHHLWNNCDSTYMQRKVMSHRVTSAHVSSHGFPATSMCGSSCPSMAESYIPCPTKSSHYVTLYSRLFWFHRLIK